MGLIEFALVFNAILSINFASRDGSLIAAEAGNSVGADCVILNKVENGDRRPGRRRPGSARSRSTRPTRTARRSARPSTSTTGPARRPAPARQHDRLTVPYTLSGVGGYAETTRCNVQGGCGRPATGVDTIGVKITYIHNWFTPIRLVHRARRSGLHPRRSRTRCAWSPSCEGRLVRRRAPTRAERGQSLVEFALSCRSFCCSCSGMLEFGFVFDHHLTLEYATREGARTGAALGRRRRPASQCAQLTTSTRRSSPPSSAS